MYTGEVQLYQRILVILAIFVNYFCLERTNQLSLLPDKDLVDLCSPIEPYQVTKSLFLSILTLQLIEEHH
ncbi:MAG: hypothetical protein EWV54_19445 [Microcystis novacekii Mn_MB_F_20050700_S1D]|uniref:Uncharacterized protein n=1 Tax=Microcystis novacekii Mn_MB_F_20050700_S1D TaxID=2486266 RepID=A0A552IK20_9CHRO|nr:MAG: hypothetical protein EWV54_19445 [Microcystis novacekii Mn_MB_F_20050700_S1D]